MSPKGSKKATNIITHQEIRHCTCLTLLRTRRHMLAARIYRTYGINHSQELVHIDQKPKYSKKYRAKSLNR